MGVEPPAEKPSEDVFTRLGVEPPAVPEVPPPVSPMAALQQGVQAGQRAAANVMIRKGQSAQRAGQLYGKYTKAIAEGLSPAAPPQEREEVRRIIQKNIPRQVTPPIFPPEKAKALIPGRKVLFDLRPVMEEGPRPELAPPPPTLRAETRTPQEVILQEPRLPGEKSVLEKANIIVGTPFRALGGLAKGTQEALQHLVNNWENMSTEEIHALREYVGQRMGRSITNKIPVYLGDVNADAIRALAGRHDLTRGEWAFAHGLGLVQDLLVGGRLFPGGRQMPGAPIAGRQMPGAPIAGRQVRGALSKAGASPSEVAEFERLGQFIMQAETQPERVNMAFRMLRRMAAKRGVDPKVAEQLLAKKIGQQGGGLGKEGFRRIYHAGPTEARPAGGMMPGIPRGAEYVGPPGSRVAKHLAGQRAAEVAQRGVGEVQYGAGAAKGTREALRKPQAYQAQAEYEAERGGRELEKMLGTRSEEFARRREARSILLKEKGEIGALEGKLGVPERVTPGAAPRGPIQQPAGKPTVLDSDSFPGMTYAEDVRMSGTLSSDMALAGAKGQEAVWYVARSRNYDEFLARFKEMGLKQDYLRVFRERFGIKPGWTRAAHIKRMSGKAAPMSEGEIQSVIDASEKSLVGKDFLSASRMAEGARGPAPVTAGAPGAAGVPGLMRREAAALEKQIAAKRTGVDRSLEKLGVTREEATGEYVFSAGKRGESEQQALKGFSDEMSTMDRVERQLGIDKGYIEEYLPRIETTLSRQKRVTRHGRQVGTGKVPFAKERMGVEAGVSVAGTSLREFESKVGNIYAARKRLHGIAVANATAERKILSGYGREVPKDWRLPTGELKPEIHTMLKERGMETYTGTIGKMKGREFALDSGSARLLKRMTDPSKVDNLLKTMDRFSAWWKARATIFRPGFMVRNVVGGNIPNLWLADVDIFRSMAEAARVQSLRFAKSPVGQASATRAFIHRIFGKEALTGKPLKIGKYTPEQVLELAEKNKVFGGGFFGHELGELGGVGKSVSLNPLSRNFAHMPFIAKMNKVMEDNARLALFVDRLRKGFSAEEAAAAVAKYIYNYDELSITMRAARSVFPFWTWNYKNWGLQVQTLFAKPDKVGKLMRTKEGLEALDPMTPAEAQYEMMMGPERGKKMIARIPGAPRGPEGERAYGMLAGALPTILLNQLSPDELGAELGGMLHPIFSATAYLQEEKKKEPFPGYFGTYARERKGPMRAAPGWVRPLMEQAKKMGVDDLLSNLFVPDLESPEYQKNFASGLKLGMDNERAHEFALKNTAVLRYKWDAEIPEIIQKVDPGMATFNRVFRDADEKTYNTLAATIIGFKPRHYGKKEATIDWSRETTRALDEIKKAKKESEQTGRRIGGNPFRSYY